MGPSAMTDLIRIFLCEDVLEMRVLVRHGLQEEAGFEIVGEADNGADGVAGVAALRPDVILLDLSMPDMDGMEAIPQIVERSPATRIVVFSGFSAGRMREAALAMGAHEYIEKGEPLSSLRDTIRTVIRDDR
jgi:DNA-binding NarL/FixJ family response regulator